MQLFNLLLLKESDLLDLLFKAFAVGQSVLVCADEQSCAPLALKLHILIHLHHTTTTTTTA